MWPWSKSKQAIETAVEAWALDTELWSWSKKDPHAIRHSVENWCCLGTTGKGKSSGPGAFIAKSHLQADFGGVFTAVKPTDVEDQLAWCRETGRQADVVIFGPLELPWRFNFLDYELRRAGDGAGLTENIVQLLLNVLELRERKSRGGGENAEFFANAKKQLVRSAIDVLILAKGTLTVSDIYRLIMSAPTSLEQVRSEDWKDRSFCFRCLQEADKREKDGSRRADFSLAADYWLLEFPMMSDRTRTSVTATVTGPIDILQRGILRELLCTTTNISPEDVATGKIIINALNLKEYGEIGALAQVIFKYCFQRSIERRDVRRNPRPCFLQIDEFQNLTTSYDANFATTCRSARVSFGLLSQNLPTLYAALGGGDKAKVEIDSLLGNTSLRIFCANGDATTNTAAAEMIGRTRQFTVNGSSSSNGDDFLSVLSGGGSSNRTAGFSEIFEFEVQPQDFVNLRPGGPPDFVVDTIIFRPGRPFAATGRNWMQVSFSQK